MNTISGDNPEKRWLAAVKDEREFCRDNTEARCVYFIKLDYVTDSLVHP